MLQKNIVLFVLSSTVNKHNTILYFVSRTCQYSGVISQSPKHFMLNKLTKKKTQRNLSMKYHLKRSIRVERYWQYQRVVGGQWYWHRLVWCHYFAYPLHFTFQIQRKWKNKNFMSCWEVSEKHSIIEKWRKIEVIKKQRKPVSVSSINLSQVY
jgi:hypothetical protein